MYLKLITPPEVEPVSLDEAKAQIVVEVTDDDLLLASRIKAARKLVESLCGPLITQTWDLYLDRWPRGGVIEIPKPRLKTVESLKYTDSAGVEHTVDDSLYLVDLPGCRVVLKNGMSWPSEELLQVNPIAVQWTCGFGPDPADVEEEIRVAILFLVAHW